MDNYSKVLTFFMENGVPLNKEQIEALKEEFLEEKGALAKLVNNRMEKVANLEKNDQAEEAKELKNKNINPDSRTKISTNIVNNLYNDPDTAKYNGNNRGGKEIRSAKRILGQGKRNMPKDREPGEYLRQQEHKLTRLEREEGL